MIFTIPLAVRQALIQFRHCSFLLRILAHSATVGVTLRLQLDSGNAQSCASRTGQTSGFPQMISDLVRRIKGRTSRLLQQEYPELEKRYWGKHFWAIGYGAWSTGNLTEELVQEYLEHHRNPSNQDNDNFMLE
nr:transposase [Leptolyngbya boryana]